mmetsp:Transcript_14657/g.30371  ORF Transcript_14657/g.30371 Transcript_14657/m.30371 type:complete len:94 (-) Transcript_14657:121-402(-)
MLDYMDTPSNPRPTNSPDATVHGTGTAAHSGKAVNTDVTNHHMMPQSPPYDVANRLVATNDATRLAYPTNSEWDNSPWSTVSYRKSRSSNRSS